MNAITRTIAATVLAARGRTSVIMGMRPEDLRVTDRKGQTGYSPRTTGNRANTSF